MLTFRRLICLLLALGLLTISAVAEMPNPTLDPNANPYDETHPDAYWVAVTPLVSRYFWTSST